MPNLCEYRNCHNLGSRLYEGYCSDSHMEKGKQAEGDKIISARFWAEYQRRKVLVEAALKKEEEETLKK